MKHNRLQGSWKRYSEGSAVTTIVCPRRVGLSHHSFTDSLVRVVPRMPTVSLARHHKYPLETSESVTSDSPSPRSSCCYFEVRILQSRQMWKAYASSSAAIPPRGRSNPHFRRSAVNGNGNAQQCFMKMRSTRLCRALP